MNSDFLFNIRAELEEILADCATEDWNGYDAAPVTRESVEKTLAFCSLLSEDELPDFGPCCWGGISMEWYISKENWFAVSILDNGELIYSWLNTKDGNRTGEFVFDGAKIPDEIKEIIELLKLKESAQDSSKTCEL